MAKQMKLKNKILFLLVGLFFTLPVSGQKINHYFVDMPAAFYPLLNSSLRLELMEYYKSEKRDTIQNVFGKKTQILAYDSVGNYLSIQSAANSRFEMKLLYTADSTLTIGIINTVCAPICSSGIHFYDKNWHEIKSDFPKLTTNDWLTSSDQLIEGLSISNIIKTPFLEFTFNSNSNTVAAKNNSLDYLSLEDKKSVEPFVNKENIKLEYQNGSWKKVSNIVTHQ